MAIPSEYTAFQWLHKQISELSIAGKRLQTFYEEWPNLTNAQKTGLRQRLSDKIDSVTAELQDIKSSINGL